MSHDFTEIFKDSAEFFQDNSELTFEEVVLAYFDCRKTKRNSQPSLEFEIDLERNLWSLYEDLKTGQYQIGPSIAFVVEQPKIREIWAASFRDRVVHHIIYNRMAPFTYPQFIRNSFACIPGRGGLDASNALLRGVRSATQNGTKKVFYLQADVRNFFVSIHKDILFDLLKKRIREPWLLALTEKVLFHDPRQNCFRKAKQSAFDRVPAHKSLWKAEAIRGLPIGNLTSQFFANVYLNELDQFVKHELRVRYYYRYVDDYVILDESPQKLNTYFLETEAFLKDRLALELHPFKKKIRPAYQGIDFVGFVHKPFYRGVRPRTLNKMRSVANQWKKNPRGLEEHSLLKLRSSLNSYLGIIRWGQTYGVRKELGTKLHSLFLRFDEDYLSMSVPVLYRPFVPRV